MYFISHSENNRGLIIEKSSAGKIEKVCAEPVLEIRNDSESSEDIYVNNMFSNAFYSLCQLSINNSSNIKPEELLKMYSKVIDAMNLYAVNKYEKKTNNKQFKNTQIEGKNSKSNIDAK
jgi:hypothetical protein